MQQVPGHFAALLLLVLGVAGVLGDHHVPSGGNSSNSQFFVGTIRSDPSRDCQINMFRVYKLTDFPGSYVDEFMNITIVDLKNGVYRFLESAGNFTFYDLNFELNKPIVVRGTNSSSDGEYTFTTHGSMLSVLSNTSIGVSTADVKFGQRDDVVLAYRISSLKVTGTRHFRRVRAETHRDSTADSNEEEDSHPMHARKSLRKAP